MTRTHTDDESDAGVDALVEKARRRTKRRRTGVAACLLAAAAGAAILVGLHGGRAHSAQPHGESSGLIALTRVDAGQSHIMLLDPSGRSRPRDLGPGWGASWSPDGRRLVFTYEVNVGAGVGDGLGGGFERIFVMNSDGSDRHLLRMPWPGSTRFEDSSPVW